MSPKGTPMATAIATEMTPASSDARAPQIMRERMSRPRSSVPSQYSVEGALRIADQLVALGSGIGSSGAKTASSVKKTMMMQPARAPLFAFSLRQARLGARCVGKLAGIGRAENGHRAALMRGLSTK